MSSRDPAKRIPKSIGTETKLFGSYTLSDVAVALFPGVLVILFVQVVLPADLTLRGIAVSTVALPLAGVAILFGAVFVYLTPAYATSLDWLATFLGYLRSDGEISHERAKQFSQIERVYPDRGVIERTDGAFVGATHLDL